ncbi:MAG: ExbD/TolR family protein [Pseudomonadota bacterium]
MAFGGLSERPTGQPVADINMIPLIDLMLVLLVIFIVTAPLLTHAVKVDLPKASSQANTPRKAPLQVAIDAQGVVFWNGEKVDPALLPARFSEAARADPSSELHLRADGEIAYRRVVWVMSEAAKAGLSRIGFVTDPGLAGAGYAE